MGDGGLWCHAGRGRDPGAGSAVKLLVCVRERVVPLGVVRVEEWDFWIGWWGCWRELLGSESEVVSSWVGYGLGLSWEGELQMLSSLLGDCGEVL